MLKTRKPKTINYHLGAIRAFFDYLIDDEGFSLTHPVRKKQRLRLPCPLPKHLKDDKATVLISKALGEARLLIFTDSI